MTGPEPAPAVPARPDEQDVAEDPATCANCSGPLSVEERFVLDLRICQECATTYAIDEWETKR